MPYCQTEQLPEVQLLQLPSHGTVRLAEGQGKPVDCPNPVRAVVVFYQPTAGFSGRDQFIVQRKADYWSYGNDRQVLIVVSVQ
jgi:hypothetical protein